VPDLLSCARIQTPGYTAVFAANQNISAEVPDIRANGPVLMFRNRSMEFVADLPGKAAGEEAKNELRGARAGKG